MPAESRQKIYGRPRPGLLLLPVLLIGALTTGLFLYLERENDGGGPLDADLCRSEAGGIAASATLLLDFRKPLDEGTWRAAGALLRELSLELEANTELRVFALTSEADTPRQPLARLCKPYDNAHLWIDTAKDQRGKVRDCDDVPAQLPRDVREAASGFCARRDALRRRIDAIAEQSSDAAVTNAYLVEALEDIELEFADRPAPHTLYIFSDMLQHAQWYSHLEIDWTEWGFEKFAAMRSARYPSSGKWPSVAGQRVNVYYVPRRNLTAAPRIRQAHKGFWRDFFGDAQVAFRDRRANSAYTAAPRMFILREAEIAAREREAAERLLAQIKREQAMLEGTREEQQRARQELEQQIREKEAELEAEWKRLGELEQQRQSRQEAEGSPDDGAQPTQRAPAVAHRADESSGGGGAAADASSAEASGDRDADAGGFATPASTASPCEVELAPGVDVSTDYPRRSQFNLGDADILVRYTLDASGRTVDDEVIVDAEGSSVSRRRNFELFAIEARETVRRWEFVFDDDGRCVRSQQRATTFEFRYD